MATMDVMARLKADASGWVAGFKQAEASARRTATAATAASSKAQAAQKRQASAVSGGGLVALAAAAAIGAYGVAAVKAFTDTAAAAVKVRRVMGGSIESASAYGAAAKLAGVDTEQFTKSLGLFDKKLVAANDNGGKAAEMTAKLGTSFTNTDGSVKNLSAILPAVADKFQSMKDGPEEAALALQLFGRAGTQMLPFLNRGSAGIQDLLTKARQLGLVIDEQGVALDIGGGTSAHTRESLGALAPSYQFPPVAAVIDGHRIVRWLGRGAVTAALVAAKEDQP